MKNFCKYIAVVVPCILLVGCAKAQTGDYRLADGTIDLSSEQWEFQKQNQNHFVMSNEHDIINGAFLDTDEVLDVLNQYVGVAKDSAYTIDYDYQTLGDTQYLFISSNGPESHASAIVLPPDSSYYMVLDLDNHNKQADFLNQVASQVSLQVKDSQHREDIMPVFCRYMEGIAYNHIMQNPGAVVETAIIERPLIEEPHEYAAELVDFAGEPLITVQAPGNTHVDSVWHGEGIMFSNKHGDIVRILPYLFTPPENLIPVDMVQTPIGMCTIYEKERDNPNTKFYMAVIDEENVQACIESNTSILNDLGIDMRTMINQIFNNTTSL